MGKLFYILTELRKLYFFTSSGSRLNKKIPMKTALKLLSYIPKDLTGPPRV